MEVDGDHAQSMSKGHEKVLGNYGNVFHLASHKFHSQTGEFENVLFYVHKASMMVDQCTQHEQNPLIRLRYITMNIHNLRYNEHKCYILAQSQGIFSIH